MQDKSYAHRGYFSKEAFSTIERLLKNPQFRESLHTRTAQVASVFRVAVAIGLEELERQYATPPKDGTKHENPDD
jgi:hypothetical protein